MNPPMHRLREPRSDDCVSLGKIMLSLQVDDESAKAEELRNILIDFRNANGLPYGMEARYRFVRELYLELEVKGFFTSVRPEKDYRLFLTTELMHLVTVKVSKEDCTEPEDEEEPERPGPPHPPPTRQTSGPGYTRPGFSHARAKVGEGTLASVSTHRRVRVVEDTDVSGQERNESGDTPEIKRRRPSLDTPRSLKSSLKDTIYTDKRTNTLQSTRRSQTLVKIESAKRRTGNPKNSREAVNTQRSARISDAGVNKPKLAEKSAVATQSPYRPDKSVSKLKPSETITAAWSSGHLSDSPWGRSGVSETSSYHTVSTERLLSPIKKFRPAETATVIAPPVPEPNTQQANAEPQAALLAHTDPIASAPPITSSIPVASTKPVAPAASVAPTTLKAETAEAARKAAAEKIAAEKRAAEKARDARYQARFEAAKEGSQAHLQQWLVETPVPGQGYEEMVPDFTGIADDVLEGDE